MWPVLNGGGGLNSSYYTTSEKWNKKYKPGKILQVLNISKKISYCQFNEHYNSDEHIILKPLRIL